MVAQRLDREVNVQLRPVQVILTRELRLAVGRRARAFLGQAEDVLVCPMPLPPPYNRCPYCPSQANPMTTVLEAAIAEVAKLPPEEQDALAMLLMDEMRSERRWSKAFADSQPLLERLAADALSEHRAGKTKPLDESL